VPFSAGMTYAVVPLEDDGVDELVDADEDESLAVDDKSVILKLIEVLPDGGEIS